MADFVVQNKVVKLSSKVIITSSFGLKKGQQFSFFRKCIIRHTASVHQFNPKLCISDFVHYVSCVTCHVSPVMFHLSRVTSHMTKYFFYIFFYIKEKENKGICLSLKKIDKGVELVGGGSVINGAYPA